MSQNPSSSQSSVAGDQPPVGDEGMRNYRLTSELARLCLPATFRDENKKLAWASSVCLLFLLVGLVGLKPQHAKPKPMPEPMDIVPVVFTPPEEPPEEFPAAVQPELPSDVPSSAPETAVTEPAIATVVAADASQVAFAVPVEGPVILAPARFAPPPPPIEVKSQPTQSQPAEAQSAPPSPTTFISKEGEGGRYPDPTYPRLALQLRQQGKVMLYVVVDRNGMAVSVEVKDSSGHALLDKHAAGWIKTRWQWPAGDTRHYHVPIIFQIK